jgi:two-component system, LytTR family, response regulator
MNLKCYILDDEESAIDTAKEMIRQIPFLELVGNSTNPILALEEMKLLKPNLVFVDVNMPLLSGLDFIKEVKQNERLKEIKIVIISAHRSYGADGFDLRVADFLVKPVNFDRFWAAASLVRDQLYNSDPTIATNDPVLYECRLFNSVEKGVRIKIFLYEIDYIEGLGNHSVIHFNGKSEKVRISRRNILKQLPSQYFIRVYSSTIIPLKKIKKIINSDCIVLNNGHIVKIGVTYKKAFQKMIKM